MPISWDKKRELETAALAVAAQAQAEAAEQADSSTPQGDAKPPGYYATCTREELQAELDRQRLHVNSHGLGHS